MAESNGLKMPGEYTEFTNEDGEMSGSGTRRWTSEDTLDVVKQVGILGGICTVGAIYYFREPIGRGITNTWNQITGCFNTGQNHMGNGMDDLGIRPGNENNNIQDGDPVEMETYCNHAVVNAALDELRVLSEKRYTDENGDKHYSNEFQMIKGAERQLDNGCKPEDIQKICPEILDLIRANSMKYNL